MKMYEVTIDQPSKGKDWCLYDNKDIVVRFPTTTAVFTARNIDHLHEKLDKHYPGKRILNISEVSGL